MSLKALANRHQHANSESSCRRIVFEGHRQFLEPLAKPKNHPNSQTSSEKPFVAVGQNHHVSEFHNYLVPSSYISTQL